MHPLVSVIMPSYNHEKYVIQALNSTLSLGYPNIELIVIDDGSKDSSVELIEDWFSKNESFFKNAIFLARENKGVVKTLNELISVASGEYIFILASDDVALDGAVDKLYRYFLENCHERCVLYSEMNFVNEKGVCIGDIYDYASQTMLRQGSSRFLYSQMLLHWRPPFNLPFFSKTGFNKVCGSYNENYNFEDFYLALKYFNLGEIHFLKSKSYNYRVFYDDRATSRKYRLGMKRMIGDELLLLQGKKFLFLKALSLCYVDNKAIRFLAKVGRELALRSLALLSRIK